MRTKEWLKERRQELGLSQKELAEKCGISVPGLAKIEIGERFGSAETWEKIESILVNDDEPVISYDSNENIENIKEDIKLLGEDEVCYLMYKIIDNHILFTYYILENNKDMPFNPNEDVEKDEKYMKTTLQYALEVFEAQNRLF